MRLAPAPKVAVAEEEKAAADAPIKECPRIIVTGPVMSLQGVLFVNMSISLW
jgi:hypothetical protein